MASAALVVLLAGLIPMAAAGRDDCAVEPAAGRALSDGGACRDIYQSSWCRSQLAQCSRCDGFKQVCRRSCALCTGGTDTVPSTERPDACKDEANWCGGYASYCARDSHVRTYCKKTCGKC